VAEKRRLQSSFARLARALQQGRLVALGILIVVLVVRGIDPAPAHLLRLRGFDLLQELFPRSAQDEPIAIVDIDEASLDALGQWPWPRTILADLVDRLTGLGAAVIGFDVFFPEPDRTSPGRIAETARGLDEATRAALARLPSNDRIFAEALQRSRVVLGATANQGTVGNTDADAAPKAPLVKLGIGGGHDPEHYLKAYRGITRAIPELDAAAAGVGMETVEPEFDTVVRQVPLVFAIRGQLFPALSFDMLRVLTGESVAVRTGDYGIEEMMVGEHAIPTDQHGRVWVHFAPHESNLYVSAKDILAGTVDPARIRDKLVLIGTSAPGLIDNKTTPLDAALPGVEVHAQLLETILGNSYLTDPGWAKGAEIFLIAATGLLMIVLVPITGARWTLLVLALTAAAVALGTGYLYVGHATMVDGSLSLVTAAVLYTYLVYANYSREESQRRQIRSAFGQYLSPALVEQLATDPSKLKLGGEFRNMTFLFCDIRSFTAISERYKDDPASLTRLINRYMTPMTNTILAHRGTIDKYIGDCIMAFWNAPLSDAEHARNACLGALSMMRELEALNRILTAEAAEGEAQQSAASAGNGDTLARRRVYTKSLAIGIGINTGDCIVGNMGSEIRFDYSVLGDAVNLASRLETQSKNYGVTAVIGEDTERHVPNFATIELDLIAVKGRAGAVRIFTLLGGAEHAVTPAYQALRRSHDALIAAYRGRDWSGARRLIGECRAMEKRLDQLYQLYEARIAAYEREPPPEDWTGVYIAETK
jgi:adenylate cyclase